MVDDCSTDNTRDILNTYKDSIKVLRHKVNKGVSAARNTGIQFASGNLIAFLDSDDLWLPGKLSAQVNFFFSNRDVAICQTEEIWFRNGKRVNPRKKHKKFSGNIFKRSLSLCLVSPSAVMIKRSLLDDVGLFDENFPACEDYELWLRISQKYPVHLLDIPLIIKRGGHDDQLSRTPGLDKYRIKALVKLIKSRHMSRDQFKAAAKTLREKCIIYAGGCAKRNRKEEAIYYSKLYKQAAYSIPESLKIDHTLLEITTH